MTTLDTVIPEGWEETTLGDAFQINPRGKALPETAPFITMSDVTVGKKWAKPTSLKGNRGGTRAFGGDVLMARITPCLQNGKIAMVPKDLQGVGGSTEFIILRGKEHSLTEFAYLLVTSSDVHNEAIRLMVGSTGRQRVDHKNLAQIPILLPPLPVQRRIVEVIGRMDAAISGLDDEIEKFIQLRKSMLNELLEAAGGEETTLGEVTQIIGGGTPSTTKPEYWGGDIPLMTPSEITRNDGRVLTSTRKRITTLGLSKSGATLIPKGAVMVTTCASIGSVAVAGMPMVTNQNITAFVSNGNTLIDEYLSLWAQINRAEFKRRASGTTFLIINKKKISSIPILLPSLPVQQRIVDIMSTMDSHLDNLKAESEALKQVRKARLGELLTGKVQVPESVDTLLD